MTNPLHISCMHTMYFELQVFISKWVLSPICDALIPTSFGAVHWSMTNQAIKGHSPEETLLILA